MLAQTVLECKFDVKVVKYYLSEFSSRFAFVKGTESVLKFLIACSKYSLPFSLSPLFEYAR